MALKCIALEHNGYRLVEMENYIAEPGYEYFFDQPLLNGYGFYCKVMGRFTCSFEKSRDSEYSVTVMLLRASKYRRFATRNVPADNVELFMLEKALELMEALSPYDHD